MNCPACGQASLAAQERCPACGALLGAVTEGALAPDLMRREPDERVLDVPAFKKREPSWKDEVRQRLHQRRRQRSDGAPLPLFPDAEGAEADEPAAAADAEVEEAGAAIEEAVSAGLGEPPDPVVEDLEMRPLEGAVEPPEPEPVAAPEHGAPRPVELAGEAELPEALGVERPAYLGERARAAAVDALLLAGVSSVVVYFAARAARVSLPGLLPAWPYLAAFLGFFGLVYAAFFTGLTGQTLGKMLLRLRVVDRRGAPPGHVRAALRATLGALGTLAFFGVAPAFLDPARRALHDRALKTRVVRF